MRRIVVMFCACAAARAQSSADPSVLQALLSEVHQLRVALERSNTIGPRIQLAVERVKMQQETLVRLTRQLDDVQSEIAKAQSAREGRVAQLKETERKIAETTDPQQLKNLADLPRLLQFEIDEAQKRVQASQAREADLNSRVRSEQATFDALNDRLNQIERELAAPRQP